MRPAGPCGLVPGAVSRGASMHPSVAVRGLVPVPGAHPGAASNAPSPLPPPPSRSSNERHLYAACPELVAAAAASTPARRGRPDGEPGGPRRRRSAGAGLRGSRAPEPCAARRLGPARRGCPRGLRAVDGGNLRGLPAALRNAARGTHIRSGPQPAGGGPAVCARAGPPGRARRHGGRGGAGGHDHAQRARPCCEQTGAGRRGMGSGRPRRRLGIERGPQARQGPRARGRPGGDRGDAHKCRPCASALRPRRRDATCHQHALPRPVHAPDRTACSTPESRLDIVQQCQTSTPSTSPSTPPTGGSLAPSRARRSRGGGS